MQDGQSLSLGIRILQEFMELDFLVVLDAGSSAPVSGIGATARELKGRAWLTPGMPR
jgi:hypothetical protein